MTKQEKDPTNELIDEILTEADPGFVQELGAIDPSVLNGQEIEQVSEEESPGSPAAAPAASSWKERLWSSKDKRSKLVMAASGFVVGVALPIIVLAFLGFFTPKYNDAEGFSMASLSDETIKIEAGQGKGNLFKIFPVLVYTIEIPEKTYTFSQTGRIHFGRLAFYIELFERNDMIVYLKRQDHIEEAFMNAIRRTRGEDWLGPKHKERFRELLLTEINKTMSVKAKAIRFKSIFI